MRFKRDTKTPCFQKVIIDDMFNHYLENAKNKGNAISTIKRAICTFKTHLKPFYNDGDMAKVTIQEHQALISCLRKKKVKKKPTEEFPMGKTFSNASVNRCRTLMATMFNLAITQQTFGNAFTMNPFLAITPMKEMNNRYKYWDATSIHQFLKSEQDSHYYPLWILILNTGLRVGEAVAVHGEQVDCFADILTVDRIFCMASNSIRHQTKSCQLRQLGINDPVKRSLYPLVKHNGRLFVKEDGDLLRSDYLIKTVFPRACKKAGVKCIGLHGLRHTYASHYMMNGGNLYDLQKFLGHSNISTTERYAHFSRLHIQKQSNIVGFEGNVIRVDFKQQEAAL
ncbi:MAG: hypothetical protein A2048_05490 [Deltaproteobacteria bacterium GWA2_45_12]|nr:MAG: hypothetical protein A2048_05490 [Deltaproteobacteria bacterium GWA2_45_12]